MRGELEVSCCSAASKAARRAARLRTSGLVGRRRPRSVRALRALRRELAAERGVPAYVVFDDATLRDMARIRPGSPGTLLNIRGVGEKKLADIGQPLKRSPTTAGRSVWSWIYESAERPARANSGTLMNRLNAHGQLLA